MRSAWILGLVLLFGCGGPAPTPDEDAGLDATVEDAGPDAGPVTLCAADSDCDNGTFCDGVGRCALGEPGADARGCIVEPPCQPGELCDETLALCRPDECRNDDDDGVTTCEGDCDDTRNDVNPNRNEVCVAGQETASLDEDCNPRTFGNFDGDGDGYISSECENTDRVTGMRYGGNDCDDGVPAIHPSAVEVCDGVVDHDCDGVDDIDEPVCPCIPAGASRPCGTSSVGRCRVGVETCGPLGWVCSGAVDPIADTCNGEDDDCNGVTDDGCNCLTGTTRPCGVGACRGNQDCVTGSWTACDGPAPTTELCNGVDDNCNGIDDTSDPAVVGRDEPCGLSTGICRMGTQSCIGSTLVCGGPSYIPPAGTETCNHLDDDCVNGTDNGVAVAACSASVSAANRLCVPASVCSNGVLGAPAANTPATGNPPAAIYSVWSGDLGRSSVFSASAYVGRWAARRGLGWVSLVVTPDRTPRTTEVMLLPDGLPALASNQHGLVAAVNFGSIDPLFRLYHLNGAGLGTAGLDYLAGASLASICDAPEGSTKWFTLQIEVSAPMIIARIRTGTSATPQPEDCNASIMVTLPDQGLDFWRDLYGETAPYPRYFVGIVGDDDDGDLRIQQPALRVERRVSGSDRNSCIGCP